MSYFISWLELLRRWYYSLLFTLYLVRKPRVRARIGLEVDHPLGAEEGSWLYYDFWPQEWKNRVKKFYLAFALNKPLPMEDPLPLSPNEIRNYILYRSVELARDTYFAQVAHVIWLDTARKVSWWLEDWSDHELSYLLSSKVCFKALRSDDDELYYGVYVSSRSEATENILHDPRIAYQFMKQEPEQGHCLIGHDPSETGKRLSGWFHDYLWHNPAASYGFSGREFHKTHPLLADRLVRYEIEPFENSVYVTPLGCGSASSLFADLMRAVNIPVRKVNNALEDFDGTVDYHSGLIFDWQGGSGNGRYLLHTDDLYTTSYFKDPAPNPPDENRGIALWDHVWLNPTEFGQHFSYDSRPHIFANASIDQKRKFWEMRDRLACSQQAVYLARGGNLEGWINFLQSYGCTEEEARVCWETVQATVQAYGEGDLEQGFQRLLDGPDSRHTRWCSRTGKC